MASDRFADLLVHLGREGIELAIDDGGGLIYRPTSRVGSDLLKWLTNYRRELLDLLDPADCTTEHGGALEGVTTPEALQAAAETYIERMGIADELHLETHVGSPAWLIAVGEAIAAESNVLAQVDA